MNVILDTNAVLYYLADKEIYSVCSQITISFITEIELLSYPFIKKEENELIKSFLKFIKIENINSQIKEYTIFFRKKYKLKIPDAIICATAHSLNLPLVTNDKQIFKIKENQIIDYKEFKDKYTKRK